MGLLNDLLELNDDGGCDNLKKINHKRALFSIVLKISAALFTFRLLSTVEMFHRFVAYV